MLRIIEIKRAFGGILRQSYEVVIDYLNCYPLITKESLSMGKYGRFGEGLKSPYAFKIKTGDVSMKKSRISIEHPRYFLILD